MNFAGALSVPAGSLPKLEANYHKVVGARDDRCFQPLRGVNRGAEGPICVLVTSGQGGSDVFFGKLPPPLAAQRTKMEDGPASPVLPPLMMREGDMFPLEPGRNTSMLLTPKFVT